jgi:hypothetical protein
MYIQYVITFLFKGQKSISLKKEKKEEEEKKEEPSFPYSWLMARVG